MRKEFEGISCGRGRHTASHLSMWWLEDFLSWLSHPNQYTRKLFRGKPAPPLFRQDRKCTLCSKEINSYLPCMHSRREAIETSQQVWDPIMGNHRLMWVRVLASWQTVFQSVSSTFFASSEDLWASYLYPKKSGCSKLEKKYQLGMKVRLSWQINRHWWSGHQGRVSNFLLESNMFHVYATYK